MRAGRTLLVAAVLALTGTGGGPEAAAHGDEKDEHALTVPKLYEPPAPGTYELPPIGKVGNWKLVDSQGGAGDLPGLSEGQVALVSFVYRSCSDASGCPLASATVRRVDRELARRPELRKRVRLVTVSFDPARDTPQKMAELRELMAPKTDWVFLTARNAEQLEPVLNDYGQDAVRLLGEDQLASGQIRHVLKVFLVDAQRRVRNIYSADFLNWHLLMSDIETLLAP